MTEKPDQHPELFSDIPTIDPEPKIKQIKYPIWTENKAKLIERYLYYFVMITHHGTYIDGFAGPQQPDKPHTWAAKLVVESEPKWFRNFFFCDKDPIKYEALERLRVEQPAIKGRSINTYLGDFNDKVDEILGSAVLGEKEASFCLLDQRTLQCKWRTLQKIAKHKQAGRKIELFYFLGVGWLHRSLHASKGSEPEEWWGRPDWESLKSQGRFEIARLFEARFKMELGYKSAKSWPVYESAKRDTVMYYMIHATDHPAAPGLMSRAYERAVLPKESREQLRLDLETPEGGTISNER